MLIVQSGLLGHIVKRVATAVNKQRTDTAVDLIKNGFTLDMLSGYIPRHVQIIEPVSIQVCDSDGQWHCFTVERKVKLLAAKTAGIIVVNKHTRLTGHQHVVITIHIQIERHSTEGFILNQLVPASGSGNIREGIAVGVIAVEHIRLIDSTAEKQLFYAIAVYVDYRTGGKRQRTLGVVSRREINRVLRKLRYNHAVQINRIIVSPVA